MILATGGTSTVAESSDLPIPGGSIDSRPVLIVTGLVQEAKIAAGPGMTVICSSSDPVQLRSLLADIDSTSIRGVISFGVAGGLDPVLKTGTIVLATEVVAAGRVWSASEQLSAELLAGSGVGNQKVVRGGLVGVEKVVTGQAGKAALRSEFGASAVDMESHIAAEFAAQAGLPFAALRVVSDPATRALPEIATTAIKPNGDVDLRKVLRGIARNPLVIRALVSTGRDFNRALRSLRDCRSFLLSRIGLASAEA